ncbi:ribonuclease P protein component [Tyzzerella sp. An114]|uniref:ribonuclease P protein component n=1 Tax=Tyzzerella sp. An114 TaxID=1965545 RepID=UPI000B441B62|nr:ribonuclease P protein component [Tyzzerella sp. An114]OUQ59086.1 ribonuclease P protein component [Tyzzerella sp. An114]HIT73464.1 ribonuclease P protein component [Candidatus Fimicola cottocaccae]
MEFTESLKKNYHFRYVYNKGKSIANRHLVMYVHKNGKDTNRLGISVSKKVGKSVTRSRVTRLIRESYRLMEKDIKSGFDIVVIARVSSAELDYFTLDKSLKHLMKKHNLFKSVKSDNTTKNKEGK